MPRLSMPATVLIIQLPCVINNQNRHFLACVKQLNNILNLILCFHASLYMGLLRPAWCKLFSVTLLHLEARHGVERVNSHVHLLVPAACALYDAPEDGCILHPKHVEQGKF